MEAILLVNGPSPVTVNGASGDCKGGLSELVTVRFSAPIYIKGNYSLTLKAGTDGTTINDECDIQMPQQTISLPENRRYRYLQGLIIAISLVVVLIHLTFFT